ncbi:MULTISPECIES: carboxypeptidase regulatory-like domain-containing protein [unclassified Sphingomonas]|uniref:TonB-dependent receptor n=1 Tax=unclassified Sphingomonas TaxID=196159 RepID=UPI00226AB2AC|nr:MULTISPECIES: carboxypeptidase regulatory-like domain-containing protein [unclassified Sphingomonas]
MRNNLFMGVALVALVAPAGVMAQETTSSIRGSVTNAGAPVAGASVVATNVPSGTRSTATTDADGAFNLNGLRPGGPYTVEVTSPQGNTTVTDIQTVTTQTYDLPIDLGGAGAGGPDIVVTAASIGKAGSNSQGPVTVLTSAQIAQVATINRDVRDLERRDPFARLDDTPTGGRAVSFAGQNARYNSFTVDGVPITDNFGLNTDGLPSRRSPIPLDAIGQFQAKVATTDVRDGNFQGGLVNLVLRSGTNNFQGTGFYSRQTDGLSGDRTGDLRINLPKYGQDNYGAELSGPIIKDKLFFMVSGERIRGAFPLVEGTATNNAGTIIPNISQAQVDQVVAIAQSKYGYNAGGVLTDSGDKDDRIVGKLDWNITDRQRFALTGTYAKDQININSSNTFVTGTPGLGLSSNAYISGNRLYTVVGQLNSDWTDSFSTELRGFYKNYVRLAQPLLGNNFAQFRICDAATSDRAATGGTSTTAATSCASGNGVISIGPDNSRQTNQLNSHTWGGLAQARLTMNGHDLRVFTQIQDTQIYNAFVQNSAGNYYFDSIADFQAGNAQSLTYSNAVPSDNPVNAAARFGYQSYTFGVQDNWRISDTLNVSYGARYDLYGGHAAPAFSPSFTNRYANGAVVMGQNTIIGPNTQFINGLGLFQPRGGFDYKPVKNLSIRGSGGIIAGGTPDVYVSNSFSNTGILTNTVTIRQQNNGVYTGVDTQGTGVAALQNVTGTSIPGAVNTYLNSATVSSTAVTNALARNFKIPSQFRATLSADYKLDLLGGQWTVGADGFYSKVRNQVYFTDIRSTPVAGALTPDGRQRYTGVTSFADTNSDIFLTNTSKGRSYIGVARFDAAWDFGLSLFGSFTYQDVKDQAPATSSTASSNYANGAFVDPNNVAYGISNDQVKYFYKYGVTYDHAFFRDYKTTLSLFGETRIGHPYSYTFLDPSTGRSPIFGTIGSGSRYLMYVPTFGGDSKVSYDTVAHQQQIEQYFQAVGLGQYQGQVSQRNVFHSPWFTKLDLHLSQELPTFVGKSRITVFADIENFTNLLNRKWGQISEYVFNYNVAPVRVQCLTAPVATGVAATTAQQVTTTAQTCAQYRYTPAVTNADGSFQAPALSVYARQSLYAIRLGARFSF